MVEVRCKVGNGNAFTNLHRGLGMPERVWGMARDPGVRARVPHRHPEHLPGRAGEHFASEVRSSSDSVVPISSMSTRGRRPTASPPSCSRAGREAVPLRNRDRPIRVVPTRRRGGLFVRARAGPACAYMTRRRDPKASSAPTTPAPGCAVRCLVERVEARSQLSVGQTIARSR